MTSGNGATAEQDTAVLFDQVYAYSVAGGSATALVDDPRANHVYGFRSIG